MIREVDRMFQVLVSTMTSTAPDRLTQPFEVADLYQNILPYRLYRRELGLETNQDYELTLTELLSGAGDYLLVEERMRDALVGELASPNPDPGAFRQFASSQVTINPDALARIAQRPEHRRAEPTGGAPAARAPETPATTRTGAISAVALTPAEPRPAAGGRPAITASPGETCRFCGGVLPEGRPITYCPHCGQDQTVLHCDACGTELEVGWKFCTTCGRKVGGG